MISSLKSIDKLMPRLCMPGATAAVGFVVFETIQHARPMSWAPTKEIFKITQMQISYIATMNCAMRQMEEDQPIIEGCCCALIFISSLLVYYNVELPKPIRAVLPLLDTTSMIINSLAIGNFARHCLKNRVYLCRTAQAATTLGMLALSYYTQRHK